jgi:hypothetical protein
MSSDFGTVQVVTGKPLLHNPCGIHAGILAIAGAKKMR